MACRSWVKALCVRHGAAIQSSGVGGALPALRALQKALTRLHEDLAATCEGNMYTLEYLCSAGKQQPLEQPQGKGKKQPQQQLEGAAAESEEEEEGTESEEQEESEQQEDSEQEGDDSASDSE